MLYMNEIIEVSMQEEGEAEIEESDAGAEAHLENGKNYSTIFEIDKNDKAWHDNNNSFGFQEEDESIE